MVKMSRTTAAGRTALPYTWRAYCYVGGMIFFAMLIFSRKGGLKYIYFSYENNVETVNGETEVSERICST